MIGEIIALLSHASLYSLMTIVDFIISCISYIKLCLFDETASVEKQKFVYIMNRDSANRLTISSPLEAHKNETILFALCGVDVGFDNPMFAMIELEYTESDQDPSGDVTPLDHSSRAFCT